MRVVRENYIKIDTLNREWVYSPCVCACGKTKDVLERNLENGVVRSCGCKKSTSTRKRKKVGKFKEGDVVFDLLIVARNNNTVDNEVAYICSCICNSRRFFTVRESTILSGEAKSCGCGSRKKEDALQRLDSEMKINMRGKKRFSWLTIEKRITHHPYPTNGSTVRYVSCMCSCGRRVEKPILRVLSLVDVDCGCGGVINIKRGTTVRNWRLATDVEQSRLSVGDKRWYVKAICLCGNKKLIGADNIVNPLFEFCGCEYDTYNWLMGQDIEAYKARKAIGITIGCKYRHLTVIGYNGSQDTEEVNRVYRCKCTCGGIIKVQREELLKMAITHCGCKDGNPSNVNMRENLSIGTRIENLVVMGKLTIKESSQGTSTAVYPCKCRCGNAVYIPRARLIKGTATSCGKCGN